MREKILKINHSVFRFVCNKLIFSYLFFDIGIKFQKKVYIVGKMCKMYKKNRWFYGKAVYI